MALWADIWNIKCQWDSLGSSGRSQDSRDSRWTWRSSLTLRVLGDTWAVIPAEGESPLVPAWLFTHTPPHTCCGDPPEAKEYAVIPLIHSIWWHHVTVLLYGSTSKQITLKLCPTPAFNQTQSSYTCHWKERININTWMEGFCTICGGGWSMCNNISLLQTDLFAKGSKM